MDRSQWISLVFIVLLILLDVFILAPAFRSEAESSHERFPWQRTGEFLAFVGVAAIWWPDVVGAVILFARFGPLPDSWSVVVRGLGWVLLFAVVVMRVQCIRQLL